MINSYNELECFFLFVSRQPALIRLHRKWNAKWFALAHMQAQFRLVHAIYESKQWNSLITHSSVLLMCGWWGSFVSSLNANAILMIKTIVYCLLVEAKTKWKQKYSSSFTDIYANQIFIQLEFKRFICKLKAMRFKTDIDFNWFSNYFFFSPESRTKCGMFQVNQHNMKWYALNIAGRPKQFWFNSEKPTTYMTIWNWVRCLA